MGENKDTVIVLSGKLVINYEDYSISILLPSGYPYKPPKFYILEELEEGSSSHVKSKNNQVTNSYLKKWRKEPKSDEFNIKIATNAVFLTLTKRPPRKSDYRQSAVSEPEERKMNSDDRQMAIAMLMSKIDTKLTEYTRYTGECESRTMQALVQLSSNKGKLMEAKTEVKQRWEALMDEVNK